MAHRNFITEDDDAAQEGPSFTLGGHHRVSGDPWEEDFHCVAVTPAGVLADLTASVGIDKKGRMVLRELDLMRYFQGVVLADEWERFDALVHDQDRVVAIERLGDIMQWLTEELTGTPTTPRSVSQVGPRRTGSTSAGDSPGPGIPARAS